MKIKRALVALAAISCLAIGLRPGHSLAASGTIYVNPATSSVQIGNTASIQLRINPGTTVNAVQATLSYNAADLQFISTSLSAFPTCVQNSGGSGSVTLSCATLGGGTSSDSLIATIAFKALVGSGSTNLPLTNVEAAYNGTYTDPAATGGTMQFTSPPVVTPSPAPTPAPSTKPVTTTPKTTPAAAPEPAAAAPAVTLTTTLKAVQFDTAGITVSTSVPVQASIAYGTTKDNLNQTTTAVTIDKTTTLPLPTSLTPGTTYYYKVIATAAGQTTASSVQALTTKGFTVSILVLDSQHNPIVGKPITLHSATQTAKTNEAGVATFQNTAPGAHHIEYNANGHTYSEAVYIYNNLKSNANVEVAPAQNETVTLTGLVVRPSEALPGLAIAGTALVILASATYAVYRWTPLLKPLKARVSFTRSMASRYTVGEIADIEKYLRSKDSPPETPSATTKGPKK
ncbi:MAG TPA: cohesin domain-containing protein [Candidatus Saccharimonadales bacterium]|nr:cohesin domain-containing protein [Candidatus Saccharimonadales bacterium]